MRRLGLTKVNSRPLLKTVGGRPHAKDDDHEETADIGTEKMTPHEEEDILREPDSSSDSQSPLLSGKSTPSITSHASNIPQTSAGKRRNGPKAFNVPKRGAFEYRKASKEQIKEGDETKENERPSSQFSSGKREVEEAKDIRDEFGFEHTRPKKKPKNGPFINIHAAPPAKTTYGGTNRYGLGIGKGHNAPSKAKSARTKRPQTYGKKNEPPVVHDESDDSDISMMSIEETLGAKPPKSKKKQSRLQSKDTSGNTESSTSRTSSRVKSKRDHGESDASGSSSADIRKAALSCSAAESVKPQRPNLLEQLSSYGHSITSRNNRSSAPSNGSLPNLDPNSSGSSSPLSSISNEPQPPQESVQDLQKYLADLKPTSSADDRCPVCHEAVDERLRWEFQRTHPKMNVRDQSLFCREHKKRKAQEQYEERGYPQIDWGALDRRIKKCHPRLEAVLKDTTEEPSYFRQLHAEKVKLGEDRTLLTTLSKGNIMTSTTGYYGSRGARAMMEAITREFAEQIRECMVKDKVVSFGGIGNFVQKVLVPELSVRLMMEDLGVEEERAREVLGESGGIGELVNEEVEDEVRLVEQEQEKNEDDL
ncbi:hypothetical protein K469DRAFT_629717 [Zopfia rhizophila CBS 207.26]|uniref:Restriction of telomere capping protein 4 n=1 Tax=Zopfia rhizophila CBS 207.26 TaxID=1314779 RepID=A0A6A6E4W5_9PEZI|nr:hypothetical protein K469DRAFT_629717 [Zopfia rhizophila CBS 207.26]